MVNKMSRLENIARSKSSRGEIMIFGAKDWIVDSYAKLSVLVTALRETGRLRLRQVEPPFIQRHLFPLLQSGARALMYLAVAYQPGYFGMPISQLTFLESSVTEIFTTLNAIQNLLTTKLVKDMFRIRNLFECLELKSRIPSPENPINYVSHPKGMQIEVKDVSFQYKPESPYVLKNVSFMVKPGEIVSIVGYNGSGKIPH